MVHIAQESNTISSNVKVVVRVRPENQREQNCAGSCIVRVLDENVLVFDPKEEASPDFYHGKRRKGRDFTRRKNRDLKFAFDRVFDQHETNEDVFNNTTKSIIESVLNGYNCSVFAYGATGAGKTHTMLGNPNHPGVIFLTMMRLYEVIEQIRDEKTCDVAVSYLEVYNEKIKDLLQPSTGFLPVREDPQKGVVVAGLSLHKPKSAEELMHMLAFGNCNRTQHPTDANAESSRSHAVFQVFVRQKDRTANISTNVRVGKMSLIDLAGSERATVTTNRGARFREGANINRSLLALGNCINALADDKRKGHIPYRNSKLTRLLKDSLGGNCRTVMIAAVSPSTLSLEDTYNTLRYADRAKHIKANLKKNVMSIDVHVSRYAQICDELRAEVSQLKTKLRKYESGAGTCKSMVMCDQSDEVDDLLRKIRYVFSARVSIHKEIMDLECSQRDVEFRIYRKERTLARLDCVHLEKYTQNEIMNKVQRQITSAQSRRCTLVDKTGTLNERLDENGQWLERVKTEIAVACKGEQVPEIVDMALHAGHLEVELRDTRRQVKHLKKLVKAQDRDTQASESLLFNLLSLVKKQHLLLKGNNLATSDIVSEFDSIQSTVVDDREISWADQSFSVSGESTISRLTDLPVISCVATPKAPVGRKQRRSSKSQTPKTPSRKSFIAADNAMTPGKNSQNVKGQTLCFSPSGSPLTSGTESSLSLACVSGSQSADSPEASHQITAKAGATPAPKEMKPVDDGHESKAQVEKKAGGTRPEKQAEADAVRYLRVEKGNDSIKSSEAIDLVSNAYGKNLHVSHDSLTTSKDSREVPLSRDLGGLLRLEHGRSYSVEAPQAHLAICEANSVTSLPSLSQSPPIVVSSDSSLSQHSVDDTYVIPVEDDQLCAEVVPPVIIESTSVNSVISTLESPKVTATGTDVAETFTSYTEEGGSSGEGKQIHLRLCGGATVTKAKCDSGTNQATKVPRALTFDTPTVKKSFADVVKSPPNSSILLSAYNSLRASSPLATQLSQTPVGDTCRNDENRAVVKSGSKHRRAATGPDQHLYLRRLGREREGQGDHDDQCSASPLREVNIGNGTLQRMGLPSMQKGRMAARGTPKYMKMTASAAIKRRNNHVRSLSSKENAPCELMSNPRRQSVYQRGRGNGGTMDGRKTGPKFRSQSCRTLSERNKLTTSLLYPKGQSRFETRSLDNEHHVPRLQATHIKTSTPPTAQNTGPAKKRPTPVNTTQKNMTQEKIGDFTKLSDTTSRNQNVAKSLPCSTPTDITWRVKPSPGRVQPRPIMATPCVNSSGRPLTPVSANSMRSNAAKRFAAQRKVQNFPPPCKVPARAGNVTADAKPLAKPFAWPRRLATSALAKLKLTVSSVHS